MICLCLVYAFSSLLLSLCFVRPHHTSCGILVPWPGMEPVPPAVEVHSPLSLQEIPMVFTYYSGTSWLCSGNARCSILGNHFFISVTKFSSTIPSYPLSSFFSRIPISCWTSLFGFFPPSFLFLYFFCSAFQNNFLNWSSNRSVEFLFSSECSFFIYIYSILFLLYVCLIFPRNLKRPVSAILP